MKRKVAALILICALLTLCSCAASRTPEETLSGALDAIKAEEYAKLPKYFSISEDVQAKITEYIQSNELPMELLRAFVDKMTYVISSASISEDEQTASVSVQVTNIAAAKALLNNSAKLIALTASADFINAEEAEQNQMLVTLLTQIFTDPDVDMGVSKLDVELFREDKAWKLRLQSEEDMYKFADIYLGGAYSALSGFLEYFE